MGKTVTVWLFQVKPGDDSPFVVTEPSYKKAKKERAEWSPDYYSCGPIVRVAIPAAPKGKAKP